MWCIILTPMLISVSNKEAGEVTVRAQCYRSMKKSQKPHCECKGKSSYRFSSGSWETGFCLSNQVSSSCHCCELNTDKEYHWTMPYSIWGVMKYECSICQKECKMNDSDRNKIVFWVLVISDYLFSIFLWVNVCFTWLTANKLCFITLFPVSLCTVFKFTNRSSLI